MTRREMPSASLHEEPVVNTSVPSRMATNPATMPARTCPAKLADRRKRNPTVRIANRPVRNWADWSGVIPRTDELNADRTLRAGVPTL